MRNDLSVQNESQEERLLRAALRDHAPADVDSEGTWASVASRLHLARAATPTAAPTSAGVPAVLFPGAQRPGTGRTGRPIRWRYVVLVAAAVVALVLALAGATLGTPYWGGIFGGDKGQLIGDERLYTAINQSQTVGDVTITIDKVYADPADTYLAVLIQVPQSVARQYNNAVLNHFDVTNASGYETSGATESCEAMPHDGSAEHCLIDTGPFDPGVGVADITLHVQIGEVWLMRPNVHDPDVRPGPWSFTFTFPFHRPSVGTGGSGGAQPRPTVGTGNP